MTIEMQLDLDPEVHRQARERALHLGVSGGSDIARQKDSMITEAVVATRRSKGKRR